MIREDNYEFGGHFEGGKDGFEIESDRRTAGKNRVQTPTWNCTVELGIFGCIVQWPLGIFRGNGYH